MSDRAFHGYIHPGAVYGSAESTAASIMNRVHHATGSSADSNHLPFVPALQHRKEIVAIMGHRFESERQAIIDRADRAIQGRFDLLGFKDLDFGTPSNWLLEPVLSKRSSLRHWSKIRYLDPAVVGDKKITWELNRHQHFVTLGQAYWMTNDERYCRAFIDQATSWMDANPPKRSINWVSSLELALRSISWLWALHLFAGSSCLTASFQLRLLKSLIAHGLHLQSYGSQY
ncbi:MAG: heparinase II/III family protein, partial [Blastocatellia bacterium]